MSQNDNDIREILNDFKIPLSIIMKQRNVIKFNFVFEWMLYLTANTHADTCKMTKIKLGLNVKMKIQ